MVLCPSGIPREELWGLELCRDGGFTLGGAQGALIPSPTGEVPVGQPGMGSASGKEGPLTAPVVTLSLPYHPA